MVNFNYTEQDIFVYLGLLLGYTHRQTAFASVGVGVRGQPRNGAIDQSNCLIRQVQFTRAMGQTQTLCFSREVLGAELSKTQVTRTNIFQYT